MDKRKDAILGFLKASGQASLGDVASHLEVSKQGALRHLEALLAEGLVEKGNESHLGPGRPEHVFRLTAAAAEHFPHAHRELAGELVKFMGAAQLERFFVERAARTEAVMAAELAGLSRRTPVVAIVTKTDQATPDQIAAQLAAVAELGDWADIVPVSALGEFQLDVLADVLVSHLPPGQPLYPDGELTDEPEQLLVAELIREAALEGVRDELPHSIAVVVEDMAPRAGRDDLIDVYAFMYVERPSQKAIVIGPKGARLKAVGTQARQQIEALLGSKVYLDLRIKVAKNWQRDPKQLRRLGFYD